MLSYGSRTPLAAIGIDSQLEASILILCSDEIFVVFVWVPFDASDGDVDGFLEEIIVSLLEEDLDTES